MWGECRKCKHNFTCHRDIGYMFGGCQTDFEPKEDKKPTLTATGEGMRWVELKNGDWQAKGAYGEFLLWKEGGKWKGIYTAHKGNKSFRLPFGSLKSLKGICEENVNWEGSV